MVFLLATNLIYLVAAADSFADLRASICRFPSMTEASDSPVTSHILVPGLGRVNKSINVILIKRLKNRNYMIIPNDHLLYDHSNDIERTFDKIQHDKDPKESGLVADAFNTSN